MQFTIPRRWYSTLPQITVEIDEKYEHSSHGVRLGAAVKVVIGQARKAKTRGDLTRAVLTGAVLTDAVLTRADLTDADLTDANLTGADIPAIPNIDAAIYAAITDGNGQLDMRNPHVCETTHCRAGWAVHLAGEAGYDLESRLGWCAAGALIYTKSRPGLAVPNFYASDEAALADIKACAGVE